MSTLRVENSTEHLLIDADDVGLTVRVDVTELDTQRRTQPRTQITSDTRHPPPSPCRYRPRASSVRHSPSDTVRTAFEIST